MPSDRSRRSLARRLTGIPCEPEYPASLDATEEIGDIDGNGDAGSETCETAARAIEEAET